MEAVAGREITGTGPPTINRYHHDLSRRTTSPFLLRAGGGHQAALIAPEDSRRAKVISLFPIPRFPRNYPAHPASRVGHIAVVAGNDVNVQLGHRLPCGRPVIDSNVEAVGLRP